MARPGLGWPVPQDDRHQTVEQQQDEEQLVQVLGLGKVYENAAMLQACMRQLLFAKEETKEKSSGK